MKLTLAGKMFLSGLGLYTAGSLLERHQKKQQAAARAQQQYLDALYQSGQEELALLQEPQAQQEEPFWLQQLRQKEQEQLEWQQRLASVPVQETPDPRASFVPGAWSTPAASAVQRQEPACQQPRYTMTPEDEKTIAESIALLRADTVATKTTSYTPENVICHLTSENMEAIVAYMHAHEGILFQEALQVACDEWNSVAK